ncbi:MAG: hypothetical protein JNK79_16575 [Chitinophagaceae bacterium]|nr:hypothetical protein [Chitinophagaceae bacterium]
MKSFLNISTRVVLLSPLFIAMGCQKELKDKGSINGPSSSSNAVVTREYWVTPSKTDPAITTFQSQHFLQVQTGGVLKNNLVVYIPGTNRTPSSSKAFTIKAASMGYHAISLSYQNTTAGNPLCSPTGDLTCHERLRREVIDGIDRHASVVVTPTNSVINRLTKLLIYMAGLQPSQGWGQYIVNGQINWSKVIVAGHSQGGALAGVIGKFYPVKRVIMFSMVDFLNNNQIPSWEKLPANNDKYFSLINQNDELVPWPRVKIVWNGTGWMTYGTYKNVDYTAPPYSNTHLLISNTKSPSTSVDPYHNMTGVDSYIPKNAQGKYVYEKAWEYLLQ